MQSERTAIVTGAGKRVGRVIAAALLGDGWKVVAHVHGESDSVPKARRRPWPISRSGLRRYDLRAADGLPPVRLLVNNAARFAWDGFGEFDADEFAAHMAVNVRAPALLIERFAAAQDGSTDSLVVNLLDSKVAAPNPDYLSYTCRSRRLPA